jgi:hypothetical protein
MKGIVFNLLEEVIRREHGESTWDTLLDAAELEGAYTSLGNYADQDLTKLVMAASRALKLPPEAITRWYGKKALPLFAERYAEFFAAHRSARSFLLTLNSIIHPEVRKIYPGADVPDFRFDTSSDEMLLMEYNSKRKLCMFAEGLIEAAAEHFGEVSLIEQSSCMNRGDDKCVLRISLQKRPS